MYSFRLYNKTDFEKILNIFFKFQMSAKIKSMYGDYTHKSPMMMYSYLRDKLSLLIKESNDIYVGTIDDEPFGIVFFKGDVLTLVFKKVDLPFDTNVKKVLLGIISDYKSKTGSKVYAYLTKREKFDKYIEFMKKKFDISVKGVDNFGKVIIEFL